MGRLSLVLLQIPILLLVMPERASFLILKVLKETRCMSLLCEITFTSFFSRIFGFFLVHFVDDTSTVLIPGRVERESLEKKEEMEL